MTSTKSLALTLIITVFITGPASAKRIAAGSVEANRAEGACGARGGVMFPKNEGDPDSTYGCMDDNGHGIVCGGKTQTDKKTCDTFMVNPPHLPTRNDVLLYEKAKARSKTRKGQAGT